MISVLLAVTGVLLHPSGCACAAGPDLSPPAARDMGAGTGLLPASGTPRDMRTWHLENQGLSVSESSLRPSLFRLQHEQEKIRATVGDVVVQSSDLIAPSLTRRGAMLGLRGSRYTAEAFGTQGTSPAIAGRLPAQSGPGLMLMGGRVTRSILEERDLKFSFHYLGGRNTNPYGARMLSGTLPGEGSAYSAGLEGGILGGLMRFSGEYCYSRYDQDPAQDSPAQSDSAWRMRLAGSARNLSYAFAYKRLGQDYRTIAAPDMANNRDELMLSTEYLLGNSSLSLDLAQSRSNVEDSGLDPLTRVRTGRIGYRLKLAGWPVLSASHTLKTSRSDDMLPESGSALDTLTQTTHLGLSYSRGIIDLSPSYSISWFFDRAQPTGSADKMTHTARLTCSIRPGEWLALKPVLTYRDCMLQGSDLREKTYQGSLDGTLKLASEALTMSARVSYLEKRADERGSVLIERKAGCLLNWNFAKPRQSRASRSLALAGEFMEIKDASDELETRDYTVSLMASLGLPPEIAAHQYRSSAFPRDIAGPVY
ncbi:MAG: hypothetical protein WAR22_09385 [Desulfomonilia bacterium]